MLNHIVVMGRLVRDPELRHTQTGVPVARFTVACDRDFKNKNTGERDTDFVDCVAWRSTGEFVSKYFSKGRMAVVEGRLEIKDWADKEGNKRRTAQIKADSVYFGDSKHKDNGTAADSSAAESSNNYGAPSGYGSGPSDAYSEYGDDEELPI